MAVTQVYTAVPADVITAARWNNEFGNIYNNGTSIAFPLTHAASLAGYTLTLDASGLVTLTAASSTATLTGSFSVTGDLLANAALGGHIQGLIYANSTGDATNDIDISIGMATSANVAQADRRTMTLTTAITKRLDATWAGGTNQGGLDTGVVGNNAYYIWLIMRSDNSTVDVLFSLSSTVPTMPTNYDFKRLIGWIKRIAGAIGVFKAYELAGGGLDYRWTTPLNDVAVANTLTTARLTSTLSLPVNFSTVAIIRAIVDDAAGVDAIITCPDETDMAPSGLTTPGVNMRMSVAGVSDGRALLIRTSATGTVASRANITVDDYDIITVGFQWSRR